jgi:hypothetical protein
MIDKMSGNPVPPGAMPKEVRDDIAINASRRCCSCKIDKNTFEFTPNKSKPLGIGYKCKECSKLAAREKRRVTSLSEAQKEAARLRTKKFREDFPERTSLAKKEWAKKYPYKKANLSARYRTTKLKRTPKWLSEEQKQEIKNFYWLSKDLRATTGEEYHVDHIIPLTGKGVCGLHVPWNLQVLPKDLNLSKHNKVVLNG